MAPPMAKLVYSRPHLQGRKLFHDVLNFDEPWRLGANEATEIDFYKDCYYTREKNKSRSIYSFILFQHRTNGQLY